MIYVRNTTRKHALPLRRIERMTRALLAATGHPQASLSLSFVGDAAMRRLNREHRGYDCSTDVLSFPLYEPFAVPAKALDREAELLLGDIIISVDVAARQAHAYEATLEAEITRLLVHGVAHLLGYDHEEPRERARMRQKERTLAAAVGLAWPYE
ncbi:MAG: rRNA maturation RNase YbeY [Candidatus Eremiobacteraeota bacterium]|nr:rRNA maturation RNase YbeY [Candidatus Eremiobacteraeota bacterium]MBC5802154.1 rRNA maturation RNase YbeY [Candidatus Eremiobacteraeota bacterium]MBC5821794.1 rRNA maturation RNase YbeY [Candidatus Eremiobacteraeota bacterium]